jgi:hypothetical protein
MARRGGWFKYGSLGCLGVGGLVLLAIAIMAVVAFATAPPEQVKDHVLIPDIPAHVTGDAAPGGRVVLEIGEADLRVEPLGPGESLRIEAHYDVNAFVLEQELDRGTGGNGAWTYQASFERSSRAGAFAGLLSLARGSAARIYVYLPADVPLDLALDMTGGRAVMRLGGLWLRSADLDFRAVAVDLDVHAPLREPMERLAIRAARGGWLLNNLGNASPRRLNVSYSNGHVDMDLGGRWLADSEIEIDGGVGGGVVHLPAGVVMQGLDLGSIQVPTPSELNPPTLTFAVSTEMGYLELSDIRLQGIPTLEPTVGR